MSTCHVECYIGLRPADKDESPLTVIPSATKHRCFLFENEQRQIPSRTRDRDDIWDAFFIRLLSISVPNISSLASDSRAKIAFPDSEWRIVVSFTF